nr:hypothetical protein [uncultured Methanospirillum sp.]
MAQPFPVACEIVTTSTIPMIVANALGMAAFSIIVSDYLARMKEKDASEKGVEEIFCNDG